MLPKPTPTVQLLSALIAFRLSATSHQLNIEESRSPVWEQFGIGMEVTSYDDVPEINVTPEDPDSLHPFAL